MWQLVFVFSQFPCFNPTIRDLLPDMSDHEAVAGLHLAAACGAELQLQQAGEAVPQELGSALPLQPPHPGVDRLQRGQQLVLVGEGEGKLDRLALAHGEAGAGEEAAELAGRVRAVLKGNIKAPPF